MEIEQAIMTYLLNDAQAWVDLHLWDDTLLWDENYIDLYALIANRFFPDELPQSTILPAVVYTKISDIKRHSLSGQLKLESPMFQFTAFALTKTLARTVTAYIKNPLNDYSGTLSGIEIQKIELQNEISDLQTSADGIVKVYTESLEYEVNFVKE